MKIALIAHDKKKEDLVQFVKKNEHRFKKHQLYATGTTGMRIMANTDLKIMCLKSGPLGGDQEMGAMIANGNLNMVFFLRDPLTAQPHEPDINALLRLCDVYNIPLATNLSTAEVFLDEL